jgi:hypothetical protein
MTDMKKDVMRSLPLSHLIYKDDEVEPHIANELIVYHYPLSKNYRWKEWESQIDHELDSRQFSYLMKSHKGQFGLFVALDSDSDVPPKICNSDSIELRPERIYYSQELNPIWIRLIMRKVSALGTHCRGSYSLGRPLLKTDSWKTKTTSGINTIGIDCRTQQLKDGNTTEVVLFHENVPLRPLSSEEHPEKVKSSLWVYDKKNVLVRWYPSKERKAAGIAYKEIKKQKNKRKQRAFIDVSSPKKFSQSWPVILKPVQDEFIQQANRYGFKLSQKVLKLKPLPIKTKYKQVKKTSAFQSMPLNGKVDIIDLRVSKKLDTCLLLKLLTELLKSKDVDVEFNWLKEVTADNIVNYRPDIGGRLLILLDQTPGLVDDRYPLSEPLRSLCAVQHINVNPFDLIGDPIESGFLVESEDKLTGQISLYPDLENNYFDYGILEVSDKKYQETLARNLEISVKELALKQLLLCPDSRLSETLPEQVGCLNENTLVITEGYLFTVDKDRPVLVPFDPTEPIIVQDCDRWLERFKTSVEKLLILLETNWPYSYRPQEVMDRFGTDAEKHRRFARRLTIVLSQNADSGEISIILQDPKYDTPHMLPEGLDDVLLDLNKQVQRHPIHEWVLPDSELLHQQINELTDEGEISPNKAITLKRELPELLAYWNAQLIDLVQKNLDKVDYKAIKQGVFERWLKAHNAKLLGGELPKKTANTSLISSWDSLMSRVFDRPLKDIKGWLRNVPGIQRLWYDPEQHYFVVGGLASPKSQLQRQPSIRQWHALQGTLDVELLCALVDVDWVRMNQLAGNPCVATLIRRWRECYRC